MGTLTDAVISTTYKNLIFQKIDNKIYYTNASDVDTEITTFASALTLSGLITSTAGIKLSNGTIFDSGGNESIVCAATGSAVNHLGITNGAAGTPGAVTLTTLGDSSNVDLTLTPKGTGIVNCTPKLKAILGVQLGNNIIYASDGGTAITLDTSDNVAITGDLTVNGGDATIKAANDDGASILMQADNSDDAGDDWKIRANSGQTFTIGNDIASAGSFVSLFTITPHATAASSNVTIAGDLTISGGNITNALTLDSTLAVSGTTTVAGNLTFTGARDIIFTDASGLEVKDTGGSTYFAMISDTITVSQPMTCSSKVLLSGNTGPTAGTGITAASGETYKSWVERYGSIIKTSIYIDIQTLRANGDAKVIGKDGGTANCHLGQITTALNGVIVGGRMTCIEVPAGHASIDDIDLHFDNEATHGEAASLSSSTALITNGEAWAAAMVKTFGTVITADNYLYLITGENATDTEYTGGKFLIEIWGTV